MTMTPSWRNHGTIGEVTPLYYLWFLIDSVYIATHRRYLRPVDSALRPQFNLFVYWLIGYWVFSVITLAPALRRWTLSSLSYCRSLTPGLILISPRVFWLIYLVIAVASWHVAINYFVEALTSEKYYATSRLHVGLSLISVTSGDYVVGYVLDPDKMEFKHFNEIRVGVHFQLKDAKIGTYELIGTSHLPHAGNGNLMIGI